MTFGPWGMTGALRPLTNATFPNGLITANTTLTVPQGVLFGYLDATSAGGGGAGGFVTGGGGGGGGGGRCVQMMPITLTPGETVTVTMGTLGAGGTAGNNGSAANQLTIAFSISQQVMFLLPTQFVLGGGGGGFVGAAVNGGNGGNGGLGNTGGVGGAGAGASTPVSSTPMPPGNMLSYAGASGGAVNFAGGAAANSFIWDAQFFRAASAGDVTRGGGGAGGHSFYGRGGAGGVAGGAAATVGGGYGAGGGGGAGGEPGAAGSPGFVRIWIPG